MIDPSALRQAYYEVVYSRRLIFKVIKGFIGFMAGLFLGEGGLYNILIDIIQI